MYIYIYINVHRHPVNLVDMIKCTWLINRVGIMISILHTKFWDLQTSSVLETIGKGANFTSDESPNFGETKTSLRPV